jgi:DNA-binding PadR family transcriptional regulator
MILSVLLDGASYGYDIARQIRETTGGSFVMKETTLYSAFTRMERAGLITPFPGKESRGRPRTYYRVTDLGRAFYLERCREWELTQSVITRFIQPQKAQ